MLRLTQIVSLGILTSLTMTTAASAIPQRSVQTQHLVRPQMQLNRQLRRQT